MITPPMTLSPKDHVDANLLKKSLIYEGYRYSRNDLRLRGDELLADYKCGFYSGTNCRGRLRAIVEVEQDDENDGRAIKKLKMEIRQGHTFNKSIDDTLNPTTITVDNVIDATLEMKTLVAQKALTEMRKNAKQICNEIQKEVSLKYCGLGYVGLTMNQLEAAVFRERGKEYHNWEAAIRSAPQISAV